MIVNGTDGIRTSTRTQAEKLQGLENSSGVTAPAARGFIHNEKARRNDTQEAEDAGMGR